MLVSSRSGSTPKEITTHYPSTMKVTFVVLYLAAATSAVLALPTSQESRMMNKRVEEINPNIVVYYRDDKDLEEKRAEEINSNIVLYYRRDEMYPKVA
ncbi:hypothetical protein DL93DRAFT_2168254 [Clavulina sp. PMI_390]|nr:hypothetical protein DL93DRAFT_2168254 [Clavulina sp. PMI_390]